MCAPPLTLFEDDALSRPIAVIEHPGYVTIGWALGDGVAGEASIDLVGFDVSGWAPLDERAFALRIGHDVSPVARAEAGVPVQILGRDAHELRVEAQTELVAPQALSFTVPCDALGMPEPASAGPSEGIDGVHGTLPLSASPDGPVALTIEVEERAPLLLLEERDGWARVHSLLRFGDTVTVRGWTPSSSLVRGAPFNSESGCHPADENDHCPDASMASDTTIEVGAAPGVPSRLRARAGTDVDVVERTDAYVAIVPSQSGLTPPPGVRFWVPADAVRVCSDPASACGCPD